MNNNIDYIIDKDDTFLLQNYIQNCVFLNETDMYIILFKSIKKGKLNIVKILLEKYDLNAKYFFNYAIESGPVFQIACGSDNLNLVEFLYNNYLNDDDIDESTYGHSIETENNALKEAVRNENMDIIIFLLNKGANPNHSFSFTSILREAIITGNIKIVKKLIEKGSTINPIEIHAAIEYGQLEILKLLLLEGGNLNLNYKDPHIVVAVKSGNIELLKYLENEHHLNIKSKHPCLSTKMEYELLYAAFESGNLDMVKYLENKHGLDISNYTKEENFNPLHHVYFNWSTLLEKAIVKDNLDMVRYIFEEKKIILNKDFIHTLKSYTEYNSLEINVFLDFYSVDDPSYKNLLKEIIDKGLSNLSTENLFRLFNSKVPKKGLFYNYSNKIRECIESRKLTRENLSEIISKNKNIEADILCFYSSGFYKNNFKILKYLVKDLSLNVNSRTIEGLTPCMHALITGGMNNIVEFLINNGAIVEKNNVLPITLHDLKIIHSIYKKKYKKLKQEIDNCYENDDDVNYDIINVGI